MLASDGIEVNAFSGVVNMRSWLILLVSGLSFVAGWGCLFVAGIDMPDNSQDLTDTMGLPAVKIYTMALLVLGVLAIVVSGVGLWVMRLLKANSLSVRVVAFLFVNGLFFLSCFFGILVISSYVLFSGFGVAGVVFYAVAAASAISKAPRKLADNSNAATGVKKV